jgi:hypothetical protein
MRNEEKEKELGLIVSDTRKLDKERSENELVFRPNAVSGRDWTL